MIAPLIQFADSSSGLSALGIDGKAFIIQLVTFVLAFLVLKKWAFGPIIKFMDRRRATIEKGVELGQQMQREKAELDAKVEETLHQARVEADKIISEAKTTGRQAVQEDEEAARKRAEEILEANKERLTLDMAQARKRLEKDIAGLVGEATEAIIHEKVDTKKDAALIDEALKRGASV